jgi:hypothetical protein
MEETVRCGGEASQEQLDELERLIRLIDLSETPITRRYPLIPFLVLTVTGAAVVIMYSVRLSHTPVELDLEVSEVGFTLPTQQVLTEAIGLSSLGASGLRELELSDIGDANGPTLLRYEDGQAYIKLLAGSGVKDQGSINLATLLLPAETGVTLRHYELPRRYKLSLTGTNLEFRADVNGSLKITLPQRGDQSFHYPTPQAVHLRQGTDTVELELTFPDAGKGTLVSQVAANDLHFSAVDVYEEREGTYSHKRSTVHSGSIIFEDLNGVQLTIRPGDMIQFELDQGQIRSLELQDERIKLKYHGRVHGLRSGPSEKQLRNLMPSWFDWLRAQQALFPLLIGSLPVFSFLFTLLGWWKVRL